MRVLICEDDDDVRKMEAALIKAAGHSVIEAEDGETAIEKFESSDCDVVVLDWMLPGTSGLEVAKRLREIRDPYIIMVTALEKKEHAEEALTVGARDYIEKPFAPEELIECIGVAEAIVLTRERLAKRLKRLGVNLELIKQFA